MALGEIFWQIGHDGYRTGVDFFAEAEFDRIFLFTASSVVSVRDKGEQTMQGNK